MPRLLVIFLLLAVDGLELEAREHADRHARDQHRLRVELQQEVDAQLKDLALHLELAGVHVEIDEALLGASKSEFIWRRVPRVVTTGHRSCARMAAMAGGPPRPDDDCCQASHLNALAVGLG